MSDTSRSQRLLEYVTPRIFRKAIGGKEVDIGTALGRRVLNRLAFEKINAAAIRLKSDPAVAWAEARRGARAIGVYSRCSCRHAADVRGREAADQLELVCQQIGELRRACFERPPDKHLTERLSLIAETIRIIRLGLQKPSKRHEQVEHKSARERAKMVRVGLQPRSLIGRRFSERSLPRSFTELNPACKLLPNRRTPQEFGG